jgi:hypothetical protein
VAWESFTIDEYEVTSVSVNTDGFAGVYGYIRLFWDGQARATLWFYRDSVTTIAANQSFSSGGVRKYYGRFSQAQFAACVDVLRNEKPVTFGWNEATKGAWLGTGAEPVGEGELP